MGRARDASYRTLIYTLRKHKQEINRIAWSPDGRYLASSAFDETICIWDSQTGTMRQMLRKLYSAVYSVAWSPNGQALAFCTQDGKVEFCDVKAQPLNLVLTSSTTARPGSVYDLAWFPASRSSSPLLAVCSSNQGVQTWGVNAVRNASTRITTLSGHSSEVYCLSVSKNSILASGSSQGPIRLWDFLFTHMGTALGTLRSHNAAVYSLAWSPDNQFLASGSEDRTIQIWQIKSRVPEITFVHTLEGHTGAITSVSFSHDGRLLASKSRDGVIGLWRTDTWELVGTIEAPASNGIFAGLAFHPSKPLLATAGEKDMVVQIWRLDIPALLGLTPTRPTVHYVNAKVVLAGDSGVGKTALGRALAGQAYGPTDSTHGRFIYNFKNETVDLAEGRQEQREVFLWDLAGQPGSRLVHQLHLPEAAVVLLTFSEMGSGDPLLGIRYWARALRVVQDRKTEGGWPVTRFLVEARIDGGRVRLNQEQITEFLRKWELRQFYPTSAQENNGIRELARAIEEAIAWDLLPKVSSTGLFQSIKAFILRRKEAGYVIESATNLYYAFLEQASFAEKPSNLRAQFETCVGHLDAQGLVRRLNFGGFVLLLPEKLDEYVDALVRAVRTEDDQLGSIAEAEVLAGNFALPQNVRLSNQDDEKILLLALVQDLLSYEIALREETPKDGSYLVFPSEVMRQPRETEQRNQLSKTVLFTFEGPVWNIYATLAVRLAHSGFFEMQNLWQNCMVFSARVGGICRCELYEAVPGEGKGDLALFFDSQASEETRYHFEMYVKTHLEKYLGTEKVERQRVYVCPVCQMPLSDEQIKMGRRLGRAVLACPMMDEGKIDIRDGLGRLPQAPDAGIQEGMEREADSHRERSVARSIVQGKALTKHYDVYISYHRQEEQAAITIGNSLQERGYNAWLVDWDSIPGLPLQPQVEERIKQMRAAAVLIGKHEMDRRRELEVNMMITEFTERGCSVMPVFFADTPQHPRIPESLQEMAVVDFRRQEPDPLERLIMGIENKRV